MSEKSCDHVHRTSGTQYESLHSGLVRIPRACGWGLYTFKLQAREDPGLSEPANEEATWPCCGGGQVLRLGWAVSAMALTMTDSHKLCHRGLA